ncbi:MAG: Pr6Pr family membrane protein [Chitinophagaceae bacterium]|nr:Pr6Pr family membrane protein [Bacteroidota bacterium]MCC6259052.1 Pr6Pr family membrane protein [Chitinophagaceae bacterium]MCW5917380.1 Pr6Pr family membrane protein [Ferruginibacter sp.]
MKKSFLLLISLFAWFAVIVQWVLMYKNKTTDLAEMMVRFFSFFTILTNILVALYFTRQLIFQRLPPWKHFNNPGILTAVTVYITVVGAVYQVALRHIWEPQGMQKLVDELLHSIIPVLVIIFWIFYEQKQELKWKSIPVFLLYPLLYLAFILVRGAFSGFYPYPFINVTDLGWPKVISNIILLFSVFVILFILFIGAGKLIARNKERKIPV